MIFEHVAFNTAMHSSPYLVSEGAFAHVAAHISLIVVIKINYFDKLLKFKSRLYIIIISFKSYEC